MVFYKPVDAFLDTGRKKSKKGRFWEFWPLQVAPLPRRWTFFSVMVDPPLIIQIDDGVRFLTLSAALGADGVG
jgi:hypothetical protein